MKLTKKLTTLAIVGAISATTAVASAANIGLVQMSQVVNSYPGYGALDMKMQQVDAQYRPQIEKKMQEIDKIKDQAQAEAEFNKSVAPLLQKENDEVNKIADHLRMQMAPQYNDEVVAQPVQLDGKGGVVMDLSEGGDDKFKDAVRVVVERRKASTSMLQTRLGIGYQRAARIIEEMEERGIIGPQNGSKPRDVLISSPEELEELLAE